MTIEGDVIRVLEDGGGRQNLTADIGGVPVPVAWRANAETGAGAAAKASTADSGSDLCPSKEGPDTDF